LTEESTRDGRRARIPLLPVAAAGFCGVGLVTAFIGLRDVIGTGSTAKLWLVLLVAAGIAALVLLRTARDDRGRVRLGIGWAVLGAIVIGVTVDRTPSPGPGVPIGSGWAVLVAGGAAVLLGGVLLAISPLLRVGVNRLVVAGVVVAVCAIQAGGYAGAVNWTDGQNVQLSVADATPLAPYRIALDGGLRWSGAAGGPPVASAGGVLTTLPNGLQMLDPSTGQPRWTFQRADLSAILEPVASADGTEVAAIGLMLGPDPTSPVVRSKRLLVLDAVSGAVLTDSQLDAQVQGELIKIGAAEAYFYGGPDELTNVQVGAVRLTGPRAGRQDWVYVPKDHCQLDGLSALGTEAALSTTCGTVTMLDQNGSPRWTFHAQEGGAQIWPLGGSPAGTVQVVTEAGLVSNPLGVGMSVPSAVVSLDARTGATRWRTPVPTAPFTTDSSDAATGTMGTIWADGTATLVYQLTASQKIWLVGVRGADQVWSTIVPNLVYTPSIQDVARFVGATPDGRILLPGQNAVSGSDLNSHPDVIPVNARDGSVGPDVVINAPHGIPGQVGYYGSPITLPTPGGVVLAIAGSTPQGPTRQPNYLLVGLR
jgi:outer membrane protein assembly factor BamB